MANLKTLTEISVVLPVYNERENLPELYERLTAALGGLNTTYEIILVDDGSRDGSFEYLYSLAITDPHLKILRFSRNFGHQAALSAGIDHARGRAVVMMDSDLQDLPEDIPAFYKAWKEGHEVVYAIREKRKEFFLKRWAYFTFYRILRSLADTEIPLDSGDFCLADRKVIDLMKQMPERDRFLRGLRAWVGFRQIGVSCNRGARTKGEPKYTLSRLISLGLSGIFSFSTMPLKLATTLGLIMSGLSFFLIFLIIYIRLFLPAYYVPGFTATVSIMFFLAGIQLLTLGIIGEYVGRIHQEIKGRPLYIVAEAVDAQELSEKESVSPENVAG